VRADLPSDQPEPGDETPANFEQPSLSPSPAESSLTPVPKAGAPRETASTFKVVGYALVAMVLSYLGMSALVAWLSEPVPPHAAAPAESVAAALPTAPVPADAMPSAAAKQAPAPGKPRVDVAELELPAGLALGADKGVLKIITPDAHTIYVNGEFAGRGPTRIVPLGPGKHDVRTRFEGQEHTFSAEVKAGRMTRLSVLEAGP